MEMTPWVRAPAAPAEEFGLIRASTRQLKPSVAPVPGNPLHSGGLKGYWTHVVHRQYRWENYQSAQSKNKEKEDSWSPLNKTLFGLLPCLLTDISYSTNKGIRRCMYTWVTMSMKLLHNHVHTRPTEPGISREKARTVSESLYETRGWEGTAGVSSLCHSTISDSPCWPGRRCRGFICSEMVGSTSGVAYTHSLSSTQETGIWWDLPTCDNALAAWLSACTLDEDSWSLQGVPFTWTSCSALLTNEPGLPHWFLGVPYQSECTIFTWQGHDRTVIRDENLPNKLHREASFYECASHSGDSVTAIFSKH